MSGGCFQYIQYEFDDIADEIENIVKHGEEHYDHTYHYPEDIQRTFMVAVKKLRETAVYLQRIDWLLSGDDGADSFRRRLKEELEKLEDRNEYTS